MDELEVDAITQRTRDPNPGDGGSMEARLSELLACRLEWEKGRRTHRRVDSIDNMNDSRDAGAAGSIEVVSDPEQEETRLAEDCNEPSNPLVYSICIYQWGQSDSMKRPR